MKNGYLRRANARRWMLSPVVLLLPLVAHGLPGDQTTEPTNVSRIVLAQAATPAEDAYRQGVAFYKNDRYREAQTEFNRALALRPDYEEARQFLEKCAAKIALEAVGNEPGAVPVFETYDPESIDSGGESPTLSPNELKRLRVKEHLSFAKRYLENHLYSQAVEIYNHVLQLDPDNKEAKEGLHAATLAKSEEELIEGRRGVEQDSDMIRRYVEESKRLPPGADAKGIKNYVFRVPEIEETYEEEHQISEIEKVLQSPVNIEFEDIHIKDVMEFIQDSFDLNVVIDKRAVEPEREAVTVTGVPGAFGAPPGAIGAPGAFPRPSVSAGGGGSSRSRGRRRNDDEDDGGFNAFGNTGFGGQSDFTQTNVNDFYGGKSDGMIPYINLKDTELGDAMKAILRPLGLTYSIEPGFLFISKPLIIQRESFEDVETRYYELRNAGAETLFKIVLGSLGNDPLGNSNGGGNNQGGGGGGSFGGGGNGGGGGSFGGGGGSFGGGGSGGGGFGGGGSGGGGFGGGGGGRGGGGGGFGGGGGGNQGGGGNGNQQGGSVTAIQNIAQLFIPFDDTTVGETPATQYIVGLDGAGTGTGGSARGRGADDDGGGLGNANGGANLGGNSSLGGDAPILTLLQRLIPDIYAPSSDERLSDMIYNPANNMLIVRNTPTNLDSFEEQLTQLDVTPKQVSIEAKFLTIRVNDLDKVGFQWDFNKETTHGNRLPEGLDQETYQYDINGDGTTESIPITQRPDGSNAFSGTVRETMLEALTTPGPAASTFNLMTSIMDNGNGDSLSVTFDYLDGLEESELLSAPRVTTMNRKPAVIVDYTTEYFQVGNETQLVSGTNGINGTTQPALTTNVYPLAFNFGIGLSVTPQIRDNDQVRLWLNPEVRTRVGEKTFRSTSVIGDEEIESITTVPTTSWQAVWTNVIVHDGDTLVLGGLVQDQSIKNEEKLPYVADLPIIGFFFRGKSRQVIQSSLLIFVTPDIIDSTGARFFDLASAE